MNVRRGEVILVDFPYPRGSATKVRPALVVQNDVDNQRLPNTIVAQITGNVQRAHEPTQVLVDVSTPEGLKSGLQFNSVVNCINLATLDKSRAVKKLGNLPDALLKKTNEALKAALALP